MVVLEAMRAAVPIVASAVGGIDELLRSRDWALPVEDERGMARALERLLVDGAARRDWGATLERRFQHDYDIVRNVDRLIGIYRDGVARLRDRA
jgi:glycosyltransferase involved in cell wall biosynthesis